MPRSVALVEGPISVHDTVIDVMLFDTKLKVGATIAVLGITTVTG